MNNQIRSKLIDPIIPFFLILTAILVLSSCSTGDRANSSRCSMEKHVTLDVTDARPREVFTQLSNKLNCKITIYPFFMHTITINMNDAPVYEILAAICPQIDAKYINNDDGHLSIMPLSPLEKWVLREREEFFRQFAEMNRKFETPLPEGMDFENVPMSDVLEEISKASGLELTPMEGEGDRLVNVDVSGMTVQDALEVIVRDIDGEGNVMVKTGNGYAQRGIVDRP